MKPATYRGIGQNNSQKMVRVTRRIHRLTVTLLVPSNPLFPNGMERLFGAYERVQFNRVWRTDLSMGVGSIWQHLLEALVTELILLFFSLFMPLIPLNP